MQRQNLEKSRRPVNSRPLGLFCCFRCQTQEYRNGDLSRAKYGFNVHAGMPTWLVACGNQKRLSGLCPLHPQRALYRNNHVAQYSIAIVGLSTVPYCRFRISRVISILVISSISAILFSSSEDPRIVTSTMAYFPGTASPL